MSLFTHETTVGGAIDSVKAEIDEIDAELDTVDPEASVHDGLQATRDNLVQQRDVLAAYVDHGEWAEDDTIKLSSVTAGDRALAQREMSGDAGAYERSLWTVAAATDAAPWHEPDINECFAAVAGLEAPVVDWAEGVVGGLRGDGHPLSHLRRAVISQQSDESNGSSSSS